MKVALIGATGKAGSRVLDELTNRGHEVTAIVRNPERVPERVNVKAVKVSGEDADELANALAGHDAIVSSARFVDLVPEVLFPAVTKSGVRRYVVVGGAGSLLHADGSEEVLNLPPQAQPNSKRGKDLLLMLQGSTDLDWTFISPSRMFVAGERTGKFRYGKDHILFDDAGKSSISFEDFALALVDELENPKHVRERFTIGY